MPNHRHDAHILRKAERMCEYYIKCIELALTNFDRHPSKRHRNLTLLKMERYMEKIEEYCDGTNN